MLLLLGLRLGWGWEVRRRVAAEIAEAKARGVPILPEDFDQSVIPDEENAAVLYRRAYAEIKFTTQQREFLCNFESAAPLPAADVPTSDAILLANRAPLLLARQARARTSSSWPETNFRHPVVLNYPMVGYELGRLLLLAAEREMERGGHATTVQLWRDLSHLAKSLRGVNAADWSDWEASRVQYWVCIQVERHAHGLAVHSPGPGGEDSSPAAADPEDLRALIRDLLDERAWCDAEARVWYASRMALLDVVPRLPDNPPPRWGFLAWALRPMLEMELLRQARLVGAAAEPVRKGSNFAQAREALPRRISEEDRSRLDRLIHDADDRWGGSAEYLRQVSFKAVADRRLTAVALAVRLYRADHGGDWPASVEALVPGYLPHVPHDPYAAAGVALKLTTVGGRRAAYSVGWDGIDNGGSTAGGWPVPTIGEARWHVADGVLFIEPPPSAAGAGGAAGNSAGAPASRQAQDNQADVRRDERNPQEQDRR
jgi:hypothetical protein